MSIQRQDVTGSVTATHWELGEISLDLREIGCRHLCTLPMVYVCMLKQEIWCDLA